jgi:hypothetical protein
MWAKTKGRLFDFFRASSKKTSNSFIGELELGWRYVFPLGLTAGFEVAGDFSNDHVKATLPFLPNTVFATTVQHKIKRNFSLVPSFTFGKIICNNWHVFAKFGLGVSWFKNHLETANGSSSKKNKTLAGFVPELGLEYGYNCNLSVIGTVGYELYDKMHTKYRSPIVRFQGVDIDTQVKPKFFNAKIGLLYRW